MENQHVSEKAMKEALKAVLTAKGLPRPTYAVAAPLSWTGEGPELLVEVRAAGISQAGDPCFPGGRIEPGETPAQAAARELEEELGIHVEPEDFLGRLPTVQTYLGSKTDVFVCTVSREALSAARPSRAEVERLLQIPLEFFLHRPNAGSYEWDGEVIWGMTAGAIRHLCAAWKRAETQIGKRPSTQELL